MKDIVLFDKDFDITKTEKYHLSVQLDADSYSFAVLDVSTRKYIGLRHSVFENPILPEQYSEKLSEIVNAEKVLAQSFSQVYFCLPTKRFTLIPEKFYTEVSAAEFLRFNQFVSSEEFVISHGVNGLDASVAFPFSSSLYQKIQSIFPNVKVIHQAASVINDLIKFKEKISTQSSVLVSININSDFFDIALAINDKLLYSNTFSYSNNNEFIYYVLAVLKELKQDTSKVGMIVSGNIDEISPLYVKLEKYVKYIKFHKLSELFSYSYSFKEVNTHQFINLFCLYKCV